MKMTIKHQYIKLYHRRVKRSIRSLINFVLSLLQISILLINRNNSSIVLRSKTIRKKEINYCRRKTIDNNILSKAIDRSIFLCKLSEVNHTKIPRDSLSSYNLYRRRSHYDKTIILKIYTIAYL